MDSLEGARKAKADADASLKISNDLVAAVEAKLQQLQDKFMEVTSSVSSSQWPSTKPVCYHSFTSGVIYVRSLFSQICVISQIKVIRCRPWQARYQSALNPFDASSRVFGRFLVSRALGLSRL